MEEKKIVQGWASHHWNNMPGLEEKFEVVLLDDKPNRPALGWNTDQPSNCQWWPFTIVSGEGCWVEVERGGGDFWSLSLYGLGLPEWGVLVTNGNGLLPETDRVKIPRWIIVTTTVLNERAVVEKLKAQGFGWGDGAGIRAPLGQIF